MLPKFTRNQLSRIALVTLITLCCWGVALANDTTEGEPMGDIIVVSGTMNSEYQLITDDGQVYEVGETEAGDAMIKEVGRMVEAKGTVTREEKQMVLYVVSYEVIQ